MNESSGRASGEKQEFELNILSGYFQNGGVDVMAFDDFYPSGHQSGVSIIMHGNRVASNGDVRVEQTQGGGHFPEQGERKLDEAANAITTSMGISTDGSSTDGTSAFSEQTVFKLNYKVTVKGVGGSVVVSVDFENPIPDWFVGKICFNLELFPGALSGKPWIMDNKQGIFPEQPNGPAQLPSAGACGQPNAKSGTIIEPYAVGKRLTVRPDDPYNHLVIETRGADLQLYDGRMYTPSGWFVVSSEVSKDGTSKDGTSSDGTSSEAGKNAIEWVITPNVVNDWIYAPVIQMSQVGYHPNQSKTAIIELDKRETKREKPIVYKITETGTEEIFSSAGKEWGQFLRYNYLKFDFTNIKEEGLYKICYGSSESSIFRIAADVYDRGVWQPVLEYFLPVQMCHMRVNEKNRVWHDYCHDDDAQMAPVDHNHFDGYAQGSSTLTKYKPGELVPGLNVGGWHDAGDDDLRVESQAGEAYILALAYEAFNVNYDVTTINQETRITEIHQSDGKNDILQQIEHGALSVVGAYRTLGRLYRGIITNSIRQYGLMGDPAAQTDGIRGNADDRWVFTEDNPPRELTTAAHLAAVSRVMKGFNDTLSVQALEAAREIYRITDANSDWAIGAKTHAAVELLLTTGENEYKDFLLSQTVNICAGIHWVGWLMGRAEKAINDNGFTKAIRNALPALKEQIKQQSAETPYGIPYRPHIWGAGWDIQRLGFQYYFLHKAYPDIFGPEMIFDALNFILGCHPGSNNMSFASGIGTKSALVAYGWNRADWSYVPGGVISGTALIRPDFPELLEFPYLWQQTEYVLGGGSSHYMFLVLAAQQILNGN
jgi:hypothetical protein